MASCYFCGQPHTTTGSVICPTCTEREKSIGKRSCIRCGKEINQQRIDFVKKNYGVDVKKCWLCVREEKAEHAKQQADVDEEHRRNPSYQVTRF